MRSLQSKYALLAFFACITLFISCSDDDSEDFTQADIEGFWRFSYADDPMLKTSWVDAYLEFKSDGVRHEWYKNGIEFVYVGNNRYTITDNVLYFSEALDRRSVYTVYFRDGDKNKLVLKSSDGYESVYVKLAKPDGLPYE